MVKLFDTPAPITKAEGAEVNIGFVVTTGLPGDVPVEPPPPPQAKSPKVKNKMAKVLKKRIVGPKG
jgi:hypothetical protein